MRNHAEKKTRMSYSTDVRRVVSQLLVIIFTLISFSCLLASSWCLAQFSPATLSCMRQSNLFPCKITTHGHRPGCSTVCNYVKTMLIEIAWKNPFIMPVRREKGKQGGQMVRAVTVSMRMKGLAEGILLAEIGYGRNKKKLCKLCKCKNVC